VVEVDDYPFNDEFLLTERDRETARKLYEKVFPALDHAELRDLFMPLDKRANSAKRKSRRFGFAAVWLVAVAFLLVMASETFVIDKDMRMVIIGISAALSVIGALLGVFGVLFADSKKEWLENRFLTERLRQFHFQTMMMLAPEIMKAAATRNWTEFGRKRDRYLTAFKQDIIARRSSLFNVTVSDVEVESWIAPYAEPSIPANEISAQFFDAYRRLRIKRQIDFADYKLQTTRRLLSPFPRDQAALLGGIAMICVFGILLMHVLAPIADYSGWKSGALFFPAIALAIVSLALRTLEEGLRPGREVERYRAYQSALRSIGRRFDESTTPSGKLKAMTSLEVLSYNEMVNFLKSNNEARFVM
jgi:hypothetical protein